MRMPPAPLRFVFELAVRLLPPEVRRGRRDELNAHLVAIYGAARQRGRRAAIVESVAEIADIAGTAAAARLPERAPVSPSRSNRGPSMIHDLRQAWRALARKPGYALLTIATLAIGIGASTAVFSVVDTLLLRPPPFRNPQRLVELNTRLPQRPGSVFYFTPAQFAPDWRQQTDLFESVEYHEDDGVVLGDREPQHAASTNVTPGLFPLLGVAPVIGRQFTDDDVRTPADVVIISHAFWQRLGRDPAILDRTIVVDDRAHQIVGVMPKGFRFPARESTLWRPLDLSTVRPTKGLATVGRVRSDLPLAVAQQRADAAVAGFQEDRPPDRRYGVQLRPVGTFVATPMRRSLYLLLGAVGFVLLIACVNAANLALTRGIARGHELSVRAALGAGRGRLLRQLLFENLMLAAIGGALGALLAYWCLGVMVKLAPAEITSRTFEAITVDWRILIFALAASAATGLIFGSLPAWRAARVDPTAALNQGGRSATASRAQRRLGGALVVVEVALSLVLLSGAGLLINSFVRLQRVDPGFEMRNLVVTALQLPTGRYPTGSGRLAFFEEVAGRVRALPGVTAATVAGGAPPGSGFIVFSVTPEAEGRPPVPFPSSAYLPETPISGDYFTTLGIPLLQGRTFTEADHNQPVLIVSETLARRYWGDENPVGRRFRLDAREDWDWVTVVGVAGDVRQMGYADPNGSDMEVYMPLSRSDRANNSYTLITRTAGDPEALLPAINTIVWSLDDRLPIHRSSTIETLYAETLRGQRFYLSLMAAFALVAGLLATVGIYGVVSYWSGQRTKEFGLRLALGATRGDLRRLVLRSGVRVTAIGVALGLGGTLWLTRLLAAQLFEVAPADPLTLTVATLALGLVAAGTSYLPARRASRVDPMQALRME
jgi:putative ABC transport system permease protein